MAPPDRQSHVSSVWVIKTDNLLETITGADSEACAVDVKDGKEIELLGLALVFSLLTSGPGDPFYNALIDSNIGETQDMLVCSCVVVSVAHMPYIKYHMS